jgi:hypothetical protein
MTPAAHRLAVMAVPGFDPGINPAIHAFASPVEPAMDARTKSGHDDFLEER